MRHQAQNTDKTLLNLSSKTKKKVPFFKRTIMLHSKKFKKSCHHDIVLHHMQNQKFETFQHPTKEKTIKEEKMCNWGFGLTKEI